MGAIAKRLDEQYFHPIMESILFAARPGTGQSDRPCLCCSAL